MFSSFVLLTGHGIGLPCPVPVPQQRIAPHTFFPSPCGVARVFKEQAGSAVLERKWQETPIPCLTMDFIHWGKASVKGRGTHDGVIKEDDKNAATANDGNAGAEWARAGSQDPTIAKGNCGHPPLQPPCECCSGIPRLRTVSLPKSNSITTAGSSPTTHPS